MAISLPYLRLIPAIALLAAAPASTLMPSRLMAAETQADDGPGSGTLDMHARGSTTKIPAIRLGTDMDVTVSGSIARVRVTQAFRNTSSQWMEATYLYPLPDDGAVDTLKMVVGQRVIIGHIKRREEARAAYDAAKTKGQKAGLVEQQRPNLFTNSIANVGPGETVLITIEYQAPIRSVDGTFSLRLPLVAGPRYVPPHTLTSPKAFRDAETMTAAPILDPKLGRTLNPTSIAVHLDPGSMPANVISPYHRITIQGTGANRTIRLATGTVPADRDFELRWRSAAADPTIGLFRQHVADKDYVMATITPPSDHTRAPTPPREMVFVIDNSGSMGGASMDEAKASLIHALATLRPQDHFNVIRFDDTMTQLFRHSVPATADQVALARRFAQGLEANGGTEMLPALRAALADAAATGTPSTLRQVIFLTDGEVSNEQEMLATLGHDGGRSHIFFVGIGSAPNDYLMSRMATIGRGTYSHVGSSEEVAARMTSLLDRLQHPAVQDLAVSVDGPAIDLTPRLLPDLYAGEPLLLVGRADAIGGNLTVSGRIGARRWTQTVRLSEAVASPVVAKLWARRRIDDVEADRTLGKIDDKAADTMIADIGLKYALVSSQTSLVAIDDTPSRPADAKLRREDLPINLPAGWDFDVLFGGAAAHASAGAPTAADAAQVMDLPQTATGFVGTIGGGLALLLVGLMGRITLRRRATAR